MTGLFILVMTLLLVGLGWWYASTRRAATSVTTRPKRMMSFTTDLPPHEVLQRIAEQTSESAFTLDRVDEDQRSLVLSTPPTATTWGFFYPVYLTVWDDGRTLVEVGIQSKLVQVGPLVRRQHERCLAHVREAIGSEDGTATSG